MARDH
jgi:hypothetical protein